VGVAGFLLLPFAFCLSPSASTALYSTLVRSTLYPILYHHLPPLRNPPTHKCAQHSRSTSTQASPPPPHPRLPPCTNTTNRHAHPHRPPCSPPYSPPHPHSHPSHLHPRPYCRQHPPPPRRHPPRRGGEWHMRRSSRSSWQSGPARLYTGTGLRGGRGVGFGIIEIGRWAVRVLKRRGMWLVVWLKAVWRGCGR